MASFTGGANRRPIGAESAPTCPRCASPNTKFCYFNNYSLSQPRYFCKSCRRYWTKGGALRNVPVGGGCRKSRRTAKKDVPSAVDQGVFTVTPVNIPVSSWAIDGGKADTWDVKIDGQDEGESSKQSKGVDFADFGYQESTAQVRDYELVWHDDDVDQPLFSNNWSFDFSG